MSALVDLLLGIVTSIGGFVEVGSISTSAQAGAEFGFQLLWAVAVAGAMLALLTEMSGRLAVMSKRTIAAAVRERFGIHFQAVPLGAELVLDLLLLTAEELYLDQLLGRTVVAGNNRPVGRLEEFRSEQRGDSFYIVECVIGSAGLLERLNVGLRTLFGLGRGGKVARWDQIDIRDPLRPRLTCSVEELGTVGPTR